MLEIARKLYQRVKYTQYKAKIRDCLKRYKFTNMRSRLIQLDRDEWDIALFLPLLA